MERILCKTDFLFEDIHMSATPSATDALKHFLSPPVYLCVIHNYNKSMFRKGVASFYL